MRNLSRTSPMHRVFPVYVLTVAALLLAWCVGSVPASAFDPNAHRQIQIEATIWQINRDSNFDFGVIWDLTDMDDEVNDLMDSSIFLPGIDPTTTNPTS